MRIFFFFARAAARWDLPSPDPPAIDANADQDLKDTIQGLQCPPAQEMDRRGAFPTPPTGRWTGTRALEQPNNARRSNLDRPAYRSCSIPLKHVVWKEEKTAQSIGPCGMVQRADEERILFEQPERRQASPALPCPALPCCSDLRGSPSWAVPPHLPWTASDDGAAGSSSRGMPDTQTDPTLFTQWRCLRQPRPCGIAWRRCWHPTGTDGRTDERG